MKEVREASGFAKFRLLMWKNVLQQIRHPKQTLAEILFPVAIFAAVLFVRSAMEPVSREVSIYPPIPAGTLIHSLPVITGLNVTHISLAYSPLSPILEDVLASALASLLIKNWDVLRPWLHTFFPQLIDNLPPEGTPEFELALRGFIPLHGYIHSDDLIDIYIPEGSTGRVLAAVQFENSLLGATELQGDVSYSLRFPERPRHNEFMNMGGRSWRTSEIFPVFSIAGPREQPSIFGGTDPGYVMDMFIALQQSISTELISRLTGEDMDQFDINIQRYPHPSYNEDLGIDILQFLLPFCAMIGVSYTAGYIVKIVVQEKELQLKETMKIMGLPTWLHWTAWFSKQFVFHIVITIAVVVLFKISWFSTEDGQSFAVFTNTPWGVLFLFFLMYMTCTIFFCFMISGLFSNANTGSMFMGMIWFLSYVPAFLLMVDMPMAIGVQILICLSLNTAMAIGFQQLLSMEATGGLQWSDFFYTASPDANSLLFGHVLIIMACSCVLYMLFALYFEKVFPGSFGVAQRWYFPFMPSYWFPSTRKYDNRVGDTNGYEQYVIKDDDPRDLPVGVQISHLTKTFGTNTAVENLSLNIYDDQITVLLGHNGAGKSTTISMLIGNLKPTSGSMMVAGYDIEQELSAARGHIGFCPQHNVLFKDLTVSEHLQFFGTLKGFTGKELQDNVNSIIEKLELHDKRGARAGSLSGGQKRRLSVGVALCGSARVVLLDEPTSGMDPSSRRALWDMLQKEKKGRSMILTTHFMDEADILGDRVAIMASGRLQCVGSPYFLKQHYGVGYTLVVVKDEHFNEAACTKVIAKYIPDITVKEDRGTEVTYSLKNEKSDVFENILNDLENKTAEIGFKDYGLVATTMEDVFLSVGSDLVTPTAELYDCATSSEASNDDMVHSEAPLDALYNKENMVSGFALWIQHVLTTWLKLWLVWSRSWGMVAIQISVPVLILSLTLGIMRFVVRFEPDVVSRALTLAQGYSTTETWLEFDGMDGSLGSLATEAFKMTFAETNPDVMTLRVVDQPLGQFYLEQGENPLVMSVMRTRMLIGATFTDRTATAWFSNFGFHDVATSLATIHSALLRAKNPAATMNVFNYPLPAIYTDQSNMQNMMVSLSTQMAAAIGNSLSIISAVFIMFYVKERAVRARLLQKASGIEPMVLWGSAAVFDWIWFLIICLIIIIMSAAFQVIGLSTGPELGRMFLCFMVYGAAMLPFNYILSHLFDKTSTAFMIVYFINIFIGSVGATVVDSMNMPGLPSQDTAAMIDSVLQIFPLYSVVVAVRRLNMIGLMQWSCLDMCGEGCTLEMACTQIPSFCCFSDNPFFEWADPGIGRYLVLMASACAVLWGFLMLIEYRILHQIFRCRRRRPPLMESSMDEDVVDEIRHIRQIPDSSLSDYNMVAKSLTKYYCRNLAVNQVSFSVGESECFGLLGVNGAGKTSTFKMLMGDESVSSGNAYVKGHSVKSNLRKVHENIGYCPQFDAVFPELTGRETLRLFSLLRGLRPQTVALLTEYLATTLGFRQHLDKRVKQFSGGNKRKLSAAVAMMGQSRLVFLDEPTTGVDPAAKRQVWHTIKRATHSGRGVVLTSHSMEECEALCSRLTIMVNGQFQCLGTPQHLKNRFSQGFTLTIKMKKESYAQNDDNDVQQLDVVKEYIETKFDEPKLMEEYKGMLTYYLKKGDMPWSQMFGIMERAKRDLHVEDYTIAQTTLEQIFLQFTKYQKPEKKEKKKKKKDGDTVTSQEPQNNRDTENTRETSAL